MALEEHQSHSTCLRLGFAIGPALSEKCKACVTMTAKPKNRMTYRVSVLTKPISVCVVKLKLYYCFNGERTRTRLNTDVGPASVQTANAHTRNYRRFISFSSVHVSYAK
ncbi:hypothetical protein GWI33_010402 [Rhynchophorus ferrugineus]|uniref:Uncharacterized protein n=1 Tax=Rhynchophorus ferrugineus TaxID=354439 RepID=A0A834MJQ0_RHYFE|nr:hypothetical protein GWI33_010402 [Rhynchophorus ferrugineus]